jgi:hypothetical protein
MKRTLIVCAAIAGVASLAAAASPEVDKSIKTIQSAAADPAKLKLFCALDDATEEAPEGQAAKADPAQDKQVEEILKQLGADFTAAWDIGDNLDEKSPDGVEFTAAVEAITAKCDVAAAQ